MSNVIVYKPNGTSELFGGAYLQADSSTILIRQKVDGYWTTTAVFAPGTYKEIRYVDDYEEDNDVVID